MSSTVSAASTGMPAKAASPKLAEEGVLRIEVAAEADQYIKREFVPLAGTTPEDTPFWRKLTGMDDVRGLPSFTARYRSEGKAYSSDDPDRIRLAIWRRLEELLISANHLPNISFQEEPLRNDDRRGIIDLVFDSKDGLRAYSNVYNELIELQIHASDGKVDKYHFPCTNSLNGNILIFQCNGLPINELDPEQLFEAFKEVTSRAGVMLGFGKIVSKTKRYGTKQDGLVRGYLQLHQENMMLPLKDFARLLPSHLQWDGVARSLDYAGREHHKKDVISRNYPSSGQAEAEASSSKKRAGGGITTSKEDKKKRAGK